MEEQIPTQPVPAQPVSTPPAPVKQNNKLLIIIASLVFLIMAGGLVYLRYQNYQLQQRIDELLKEKVGQSSFETQSNSLLSPTPDLTSTRKTYTKKEYKLSFKYPPGFTIEEGGFGTNLINYQIILNKSSQDSLAIKASPQEIEPGLVSEVNWDSESNLTHNNITWKYRYSKTGYGDGPDYKPKPYILLTTNNSNIGYTIEAWGQQSLSQVQMQVLSTIKFLE